MLQREIDGRHHAGHHNALDILPAKPFPLQQSGKEKAGFIAGAGAGSGKPPVLLHVRAVEQGGLDIGIANVHG